MLLSLSCAKIGAATGVQIESGEPCAAMINALKEASIEGDATSLPARASTTASDLYFMCIECNGLFTGIHHFHIVCI